MDGWNTTFLLGWPIFRGYVSCREGKYGIPESFQRFAMGLSQCFFCAGSNFPATNLHKGTSDRSGTNSMRLSRSSSFTGDLFAVLFPPKSPESYHSYHPQTLKLSCHEIHSLKRTVCPWKMVVGDHFPFGKAYFQGRTVSFREGRCFF